MPVPFPQVAPYGTFPPTGTRPYRTGTRTYRTGWPAPPRPVQDQQPSL